MAPALAAEQPSHVGAVIFRGLRREQTSTAPRRAGGAAGADGPGRGRGSRGHEP
jgi:hypothetical protein